MKIDWSTLALQTVNLLVLLWLLQRYLFRPVAKIIAERQNAARALIADAQAAKLAAGQELDAVMAERAQLAARRAEALAQIEHDAHEQRDALLAAAHEDADRLRAQAAADLQRDRAALADEASARAVRLAVDIARKLLARMPDSTRVEPFIDGLADGVIRLSSAARRELLADAPLQLTVPRALTAGEQHACEAALAAAFGHAVEWHTRIDATLVAGLELGGRHGIVRNSWRDQLQQIHNGLLNDDGRV
ncbi:F0F1 ATP synthase subunit delta [Paraburkholderia phymatum]|uniref:ATP synthase subunit b n=1 Tax=Paraburkholderia phymatum (strain DSM 17167 / CIP 108236 / LMG 21445 / STM815) TaxID=391038 RepID=B2JH74_PARP8|nr:F0F1 ATP synthase subunit delta [Paraburkholderia phymatum]ACC70312.1 H+transporting two-sector ATPase B/B' subunit [Paraburkholderia phymatum STM815]